METERSIAVVQILDEATEEERHEIIDRLDDGNDFPGSQVEMVDGKLVVYADD